MLTYRKCDNEQLWSAFSLFYLQHCNEIIADYPVEYAIHDILTYMDHGHVIVGLVDGELIGFTTCYIGLPEQRHANAQIAVLHNSYIVPEYQSTRTFLRGLHVSVQELGRSVPAIEEIRIHAAVKKPYLQRMYGKIARKIGVIGKEGDQYDEYAATYEELSRYCERFGS